MQSLWLCPREVFILFFSLIETVISNIIFFILHASGAGAFPKPLTPAEEKECLAALKNGDAAARNRLIERNLRLIAHIIKKYYSAGYDQDDLISIGTIGLIKAVSNFDSDKGTKFATYASKCIENEILMYFRSQKKISQDVSMSDPIDSDKDGNALTLSDVIADEYDIIENIDIKIKSQMLRGYMNEILSERERQIINYRYGLDGRNELTQREIAVKLNISRSYVSRIEKKALQMLFERFSS